jgi:hypothetical protein
MTKKHSIRIDFEETSYISQQLYTNEKEIEVSINPRESAEIHNKYEEHNEYGRAKSTDSMNVVYVRASFIDLFLKDQLIEEDEFENY